MSLESAFAPVEAKYRDEILSATWGHLAPKIGYVYVGSVVFGCGEYGEIFILFDRMGVTESPWWYRSLTRFVEEQIENRSAGLYEFRGTYEVKDDSGNSEFNGTVSRIEV